MLGHRLFLPHCFLFIIHTACTNRYVIEKEKREDNIHKASFGSITVEEELQFLTYTIRKTRAILTTNTIAINNKVVLRKATCHNNRNN
jgi:hypothetical protein